QVVVGQLEELVEAFNFFFFHVRKEFLEYQIKLQQAAAAFPVELVLLIGIHQTERFTISSLMWPMAWVGLRCFGQTSTQFMMVWQRNRRYGSSRLSRRSLVAWSRVSAMKRYACSRPAGPTNLSGFHQKDGHAVVQQAHR